VDIKLVAEAAKELESRMEAVRSELANDRSLADSPEVCRVIETVQGMANCLRWFAQDLQKIAEGEAPVEGKVA
jgi:hypothetical protein